jgi:acetyl-CoA C-acetyltransferase
VLTGYRFSRNLQFHANHLPTVDGLRRALFQLVSVFMKPMWVASAKRTPHGRFLVSLARHSAVDLGVVAVGAAFSGIDLALVAAVIVGNAMGASLGMNVARQIGIRAGLPVSVPAFTVIMMWASGIREVILTVQAIQNGTARMIFCGRVESMSNAPYLLDRARLGYKPGDGVLSDFVCRRRHGMHGCFGGVK